VPEPQTVLVAGAGIGGLTAALALAARGFEVRVLEQAERLEATGAGIQLSPNAARILIALGLGGALAACAVAPEALAIGSGRSGEVLARLPLGAHAAARYGAPYWVVHRADLQQALYEAAVRHPAIAIRLGTRVDDYAADGIGVTATAVTANGRHEERARVLIGADGLWSRIGRRFGPPQFSRRSAWRAVVPADAVAPDLRRPETRLWLGPDAHFVHYPLRGGDEINLVAIVTDDWAEPGWNVPGGREELLPHYGRWAGELRRLLQIPDRWQKWALFDRAPVPGPWGEGPVTLLGDAAHPMLPLIAQGGAMAIEDAAVLADRLASQRGDPAGACRSYEAIRRARTARVQREARENARIYHLRGPAAFARNLALRALGGPRLLDRYDWLYGWRPPG